VSCCCFHKKQANTLQKNNQICTFCLDKRQRSGLQPVMKTEKKEDRKKKEERKKKQEYVSK